MDVQQQPRSALTAARRRKGWTLRQAAKILGCGCSTLNRWESGEQAPHPDYVRRLCDIYGAEPIELGLEESVASRHIVIVGSRYPSIMAFIEQDLTSRLMTIIANWSHSGRHDELQCRLLAELGDYNSMKTDRDTISRREAVLRLAAVPFTAFGLAAEATDIVPSHPVEDVLKHWAGSIAACWELSKSSDKGDVQFAFESVSAFLPTLASIMENSSQYRKTAASLAGQCYLLKLILGWHQESLDRAIGYGQQAVTYSEIAKDIPLQIAVQVKLAWVYYYARQDVKALEAVTCASTLAKTSPVPLPADLQSSVQTALAIRQAMHGKQQQAITAVRLAHQYFFETSENAKKVPGIDTFIYADYSRSSLILEDGMAFAHLDQHEKALDSFSQIVDLNDLSSKISVPERVRVEVLNNSVFSLLKSPEKDKETSIKLWKAGIQEAKDLRSEQRFSEALVAYEMMKGIWSREKDVKELQELALHW